MKFKQKCSIICLFGARGGLGSQWLFGEFPALYAIEGVIAKVCAVQLSDGVAEGSKGTADLAVAAFAHLDDPAVVVTLMLTFKCQAARPVRQLHAKVVDHLPVKWLERLVERHEIALHFIKRWVCHLVGKIAVVGEEDEPRTVFVEATDGFEVMEAGRQ